MWCLAILWSTSHQVSTWESTLQKVTQGRLNWNGCWEVARGWSLIYTVVSRCKTRCNRGDYLIILHISCGEKVCACCACCSAVRNRDWILLVSSLDLLLGIIFIHLDWWMWLLLYILNIFMYFLRRLQLINVLNWWLLLRFIVVLVKNLLPGLGLLLLLQY